MLDRRIEWLVCFDELTDVVANDAIIYIPNTRIACLWSLHVRC